MGMLLHTSTLCGKTAMYAQYVCEHVFCGTLLHMQHWSDLQASKNKGPDVHWDKVSDLNRGARYYTKYTDVIEKERLPTISPFTDVVRETTSSVCVIVASCHMTHITPCHIYSTVLLLLYTVCWSTLCKTAERWVSMRVL